MCRLVNLSIAFHRVDHQILLTKLEILGFWKTKINVLLHMIHLAERYDHNGKRSYKRSTARFNSRTYSVTSLMATTVFSLEHLSKAFHAVMAKYCLLSSGYCRLEDLCKDAIDLTWRTNNNILLYIIKLEHSKIQS